MTQLGEEQFLAGLGNQAESVDTVKENNSIEDEQINNDEQSNDQGEGQEVELDLSPTEQKAYDQGWRPQEDFSGPEENWKTAKEYVKDGEWLKQIKDLNQKFDTQQQEFDTRLENTNKLNAQRNRAEIAKLKTQQRDAVDMADTDAFDKAQTDIEALEAEAVDDDKPKAQAKNPTVAAWEEKNPWINDNNDDRAVIAQSFFNSFLQQNPTATVDQALAHIDSKIIALYPKNNSNPRREQPNTTETPRRTSQRRNKDLTMADLTADEKNDWMMFGQTMFKTEKAYLTAVKDTRANQ
jgi:hypothetical protein